MFYIKELCNYFLKEEIMNVVLEMSNWIVNDEYFITFAAGFYDVYKCGTDENEAEEVLRDKISNLIDVADSLKGEFVLIVEGNKEVIDFSHMSVVEHVNIYVEDGMSTVQIAKHFNETGELKVCDGSSTVDTAVSSIRYMLLNKAYVGGEVDNVFTGKRVRNIYPRIVSDALFEAAGKTLVRGKKKQRKSKNIYLCKGLLKEPNGYTLTGILSGNVYKVVKYRFDGAYQFYAPLNLVDSVVWHIVKKYHSLTTPKEIKEKQSESEQNQSKQK